jgi:hypothetical protein
MPLLTLSTVFDLRQSHQADPKWILTAQFALQPRAFLLPDDLNASLSQFASVNATTMAPARPTFLKRFGSSLRKRKNSRTTSCSLASCGVASPVPSLR